MGGGGGGSTAPEAEAGKEPTEGEAAPEAGAGGAGEQTAQTPA